MFDDTDPVLARLREIALALPGAEEKVSFGRPLFFTKKTFALYGGGTKGGAATYPRSVLIKPDADEVPGLEADSRFYVPAYWATAGWMGLDLERDPDWTEVAELLDMSYRNTAAKTLIKRLDSLGG